MKKEWSTPELRDLSVDLTNAIEYVDYCNWVPTEMTGVGNEDYLYYTINNDVFDIAFDVSAFTNYNTGDIRYSKGGINVERNDISESDYEAYINELKPIEWKKLP